jgi:hypothetical protein
VITRVCATAVAMFIVVAAVPQQASAVPTGVVPVVRVMATPATVSSATTAGSDWLSEVNTYRTATGLPPVSNQSSWEQGLRNHLAYLSSTPSAYFTGQYQSAHTENPQSPYYTQDGATEGGRSDLYQGAVGFTPVNYIDGWLAGPFHAIGMLRPQLTQVAFASDPGTGDGGLDVLGGLDYSVPARTTPVLFPGPDMTTNLTSFGRGESPNPLESCGSAFQDNPGLPVIMLLPNAPTTDLGASITGSDGSVQSTANGQLCVVDEHTYRSSDPVYGPTGQQILQSDHAVLLVTQHPYGWARNTVAVTQAGGAPISWSFTTAPSGPVTAGASYTLHVAGGAQTVLANLTVTNPQSAGFTTVYPCSQGQPIASTNNYVAGQTTPNAVAVRSDDNGNVCIYTSATTDLIWDQASESTTLPAHTPTRLLDTRSS